MPVESTRHLGYTCRPMPIHTFAGRAFVALTALAWAGAASAQAPSNQDLIGTWNITLTSPQGVHPTTMLIQEEAGTLSGTVTGLPGTTPLVITSSESGVTLSFSVDYQGQPIPVVMSGKLTGTDIKGTVDYANGSASGDFSGAKAGAEVAAATSLAGAWDVTGDAGGGYGFALTQDGTAVSGVLRTPDGAELPLKGTFEANVLNLSVAADAVSGTITGALDGASLRGRYDIDGNAGAWSAVRKP